MWPHSLLFSSDGETSRALSQALRELEFKVEACPEIFCAVEKITSRAFEVIVSDWNEGLEAVFLLKTSRELKVNRAAFTIAIANAEAVTAAHEAGADLVLSRPIVPDEVKYALLSCGPFLAHMKTWLPHMGLAPTEEKISSNLEHRPLPVSANNAPDPSPTLRTWPAPPPPRHAENDSLLLPSESIFEDDLLYRTRVHTIFQPREAGTSSARIRRRSQSRLLPSLAIAVAFLSAGYIFSEPLHGQPATTSVVVRICGRVLERTEAWFERSDGDRKPVPAVQMAENESPKPAHSRQVSRIRVTPVKDPVLMDTATTGPEQPVPVSVETPPPSQPQPPATTQVRIPESMRMPVQNATMRSMAARITPSLLAALEPVALSEDLSRRLLLERVLPSYPEQAVRARLQGPVVFEAWIGRDGTIQDLKLIRGSLLLGQAAYRAVRQWRYQPYLINGRAVEAQTFVTVDFKLP
jgi:TonB family protein